MLSRHPFLIPAALLLGGASASQFATNAVTQQSAAVLNSVVQIGGYDDDDALYLTTPRGTDVENPVPMIFDRNGTAVWMADSAYANAFDMNTGYYNGSQVLTVWTGTVFSSGHGAGVCSLLDDTYTIVANVTSVGSEGADIHECHIPSSTNSSALITVYNTIPLDLSCCGGTSDGYLTDCWFQEVNITTGELIFNWSAVEHIPLQYSYAAPGGSGTEDDPWDAYHFNSIDKDADGNYLISSRHLHQLFLVNKTDGEIIWTMGGMVSNFTMGNGTNFEWQHHARFHNDYTKISLFDNAAADWEHDETTARGLLISFDTSTWNATLDMELLPEPYQNYSNSQGSMHQNADGTWTVGFGSNPWMTEYTSDGTATFAMTLGDSNPPMNGAIQNYRWFKVNWEGNPADPPALAINNSVAYFSWNGKTAVRSYDLLGGSDADSLSTVSTHVRAGFETNVSLSDFSHDYIGVLARDKSGNELGRSAVLAVSNGSAVASGTTTNSTTTDSASSSALSLAVGQKVILAVAAMTTGALSLL